MESEDRQTLAVPSLVDALQQALRNNVLSGELASGSRLAEADVANRYSVARPTAKAAIERLVGEGLLRRASNKTARVPVLTKDDIADLYRNRLVLEREVIATLTEARLVPEGARRAVRQLRDIGPDEPQAVSKIVGLDIEFHLALVDAVQSPRLQRLYRSLIGEVHLCMAQVQANQVIDPRPIARMHEVIMELIESGDVDAATGEIAEHLHRARDRLIASAGVPVTAPA